MRFRLISVLMLVAVSACSQLRAPATFTVDVSKENVAVGEEIEIIFRANVEDKWYLYANDFEDCGPIQAGVEFESNKNYKLVGGLVAVKPTVKHDDAFDCDVKIFKHAGEFRQKIKVLASPLVIKGNIAGQVCSEIEGKCIQVESDFTLDEFTITTKAPVGKPKQEEDDKKKDEQASVTPQPVDSAVATNTVASYDPKLYGENKGPILDPALVKEDPNKKSFLGFFILAFLAGLTALLTPCVFPMIPMTVSFFTSRGKSKGFAIIYGLSIVVIYSLIGVAVAPLMGPETANHLSTEWIPNVIFFAVFIVFGLSFLGLFEITLPGTFVNKMDQKAEKGGLTGVFFMAFTLVLVSFSCTGPIVGSILVSSAGGEYVLPIIGMLGFSLAFAIPFTLFAFFPGWLSSLPKSGGWLNSVKVVLGFIEIALAFKFLSIADQAFHWRILDREVNIAIWIVVATLLGVYLVKGLRLPGDTGKDADDKRVGVPRLMLAMGVFTFVVYLIPGMWGAPLKALAGYLPPLTTHDFDLIALNRKDAPNAICDEPRFAEFLHLPHGISGYFDYDQAIACARKQNKPLFIDFTGHGCTNCRKMEASVWSDPQVLKRLKEDYVVVALYIDDKTVLPENEWITSKYDGKVKKTIGKQNADLQISNLNNNAQPFYILIGKDERVLVSPKDFDTNVDNFVAFLDEGKKKFNELFPK